MPEFTTEQMTQYLQKATELEASIYRQSETIKASKKSFNITECILELCQFAIAHGNSYGDDFINKK